MKKFYLLFKKELREMLAPQIWVPFIAVIVVFLIIGKVANKQVGQQNGAKDSIAIADMDHSNISSQSIRAISQNADVISISVTGADNFLAEMKAKNIPVGIIIPSGFETSILSTGKGQIETYTRLNNFSATAGKKLAVVDTSIATINELTSNTLLSRQLSTDSNIPALKHPVAAKSYVAANGKTLEGSPTQVLTYILSQTTTVPIVIFVVVIMAAQMIASAVATEKENKTLETLLSLPISRKAIVTSKMLSAGLVSLGMASMYMYAIKSLNSGISGVASGLTVSADAGQIVQGLGLKLTTAGYLELGVVLFLAILLALAIAMILGAFAEDAKSAQSVVAPLMILIMIPYFVTLLLDINSLSPVLRDLIYIIPFSHIFLAMPNIMLGNTTFVMWGALYLLILFIIFVLIAAKIFSSDLILTMKLNFSKKKS